MFAQLTSKINTYLTRNYVLDTRALALLRIAMALLVIVDLSIRGSDLQAFYTDGGLWPVNMLDHSGWKSGYWSLHALSGDAALQVALIGVQLLAASCLLLGFYSRTSAFVIYALYISLHNRNIFVLQAGDDLLRLLLLASVFLPIGERFSIDARGKQPRTHVSGFPVLFYLILLSSVYFFTVLLKTGDDWRKDFSAVYYALELRQLRMPLGEMLLNLPQLHAPLTVVVLLLELCIPVLIMWPSRIGQTRQWAFYSVLILQLGIGLTLYVGLFYLINIAAALALLSTKSLNKLTKHKVESTSEDSLLSSGPLANSISILLIILCSAVNISSLRNFEYEPASPVAELINAARLDQNWAMFSPNVLRKDGWLVHYGVDPKGRQWDLRLDSNYVVFDEPKSVSGMYKNDRWRKWAENMQDERFTFLRPLYCEYVLKWYNQHHPKHKMYLHKLYFEERENQANFAAPLEKTVFYSFCNE